MSRIFALLFSASAVGASLWTKLADNVPAPNSTVPAGRSGAVLLPLGADGRKMLALAGGCSSSCCYAPLSDVWVFESGGSDGSVWSNLSQASSTALPSARLYHSASVAGDTSNGSFFIFGGSDVQTGMLNDLWHLSLAQTTTSMGSGVTWSATWQQVSTGASVPDARAGQSQNALPAASTETPMDGTFVLFGGESEDATLDDVWKFIPAGNGAVAGTFVAVTAKGAGPGPRTQHAALAVALPLPGTAVGVARVLIVGGGSDGNGDDHNDVWLLSLDSVPPVWLLLGTNGSKSDAWPSVRHGHTIWGAAVTAMPPESAMPDSSSSLLSFNLFGGQNCSVPDPSNFLGDTWRFNVALTVTATGSVSLAGRQGNFSQIDAGAAPDEPSPRALGGLVEVGGAGGAIYATGFGGYNGGTDDRLFNDVWRSNTAASYTSYS